METFITLFLTQIKYFDETKMFEKHAYLMIFRYVDTLSESGHAMTCVLESFTLTDKYGRVGVVL